MFKKIVLCLFFILLFCLYFVFSYNGLFIFCEGFNELDYLLFNIIGDAILVGITTYISTKSISLFLSKKDFERNNKIMLNTLNKCHSLYNFRTFLDTYNNSNCYFILSDNDKKIVEYVYKKYQLFESVLNKSYTEDDALENILNLPFTSQFISGNFVENWKALISATCKGKSKYNIDLFKALICEDEYKYFGRFAMIMKRIKYFEISNVNQTVGCTLMISADNEIISKVSCLSNNLYGIYMFFDNDIKVKITAEYYNFDSIKETTTLYEYNYSNLEHSDKSSNITLDEYIMKKR